MAIAATTSTSGSSPRARGTHHAGRRRAPGPRFIPASAGNTWWLGCMASLSAVHPRERGEHGHGQWGQRDGVGSSPRARGTLFSQLTEREEKIEPSPNHQRERLQFTYSNQLLKSTVVMPIPHDYLLHRDRAPRVEKIPAWRRPPREGCADWCPACRNRNPPRCWPARP